MIVGCPWPEDSGDNRAAVRSSARLRAAARRRGRPAAAAVALASLAWPASAAEAGPLELPVLAPVVVAPAVPAASGPAPRGAVPRGPAAVPASSCLAYGSGFAPLGASGACLRISGRVRVEAGTSRAFGPDAARSPLGASGRLSVDARVPTDYGPARSFLRLHGGD